MKSTSLALIVVCVGLLWLGRAHAARFETHATNARVPEGTVYDATTKLLWEMKTPGGTGDVHDVSNRYTWSATGTAPDGGAFIEFLGALNNAQSNNGKTITGCFANLCDWRLPQIDELNGILDSSATGCGSGRPCINPIFGPTESTSYWSATTFDNLQVGAYLALFYQGSLSIDFKKLSACVRAVRTGL